MSRFTSRHAGYGLAIHFWVCLPCSKSWEEKKPGSCDRCGTKGADLQHFDSKAEFLRFRELELMQRAKYISGLEVHPRYEITALDIHGRPFHAMTYEADFCYFENGIKVVEDVKPKSEKAQSEIFKMKKKLFEQAYKIQLTIISRG